MVKWIQFLLIFAVLITGCAGAGGLLGQEDNETPGYAADKFYKMLLWKYYEKAAVFVHPESKSDFDRFVYENKDDLNITEYQIKDIILIEDSEEKKESVIRTYVTYYKYPSVSEVQEVLNDSWIKLDDRWFIKSKFDSGMYE